MVRTYGSHSNRGNIHPSACRIMSLISGVKVERQSPTTPARKKDPFRAAPDVRPPDDASKDVRPPDDASKDVRPPDDASRDVRPPDDASRDVRHAGRCVEGCPAAGRCREGCPGDAIRHDIGIVGNAQEPEQRRGDRRRRLAHPFIGHDQAVGPVLVLQREHRSRAVIDRWQCRTDERDLGFGLVLPRRGLVEKVPGRGQHIARIARDADELRIRKQALQPAEKEHILRGLFAYRTIQLGHALLLQGQQNAGADQHIGRCLPRQRITAGVTEHGVVLRFQRLPPLDHRGLERFGKVSLEQSLAAAADIGMAVEQMLQPCCAGPRRTADKEQLPPRQAEQFGLMLDPAPRRFGRCCHARRTFPYKK